MKIEKKWRRNENNVVFGGLGCGFGKERVGE